MYPDQDSPGNIPPPPSNNFDFIVNPPQKTKRSLLPSFGGNSFLPKIILIVGGAVGLMIVLWVVAVIFGGGSVNVGNITGLVQTQQEIIRVSDTASESIFGQELRNSSATTRTTVISQQNQWTGILGEEGRKLSKEELALKQNAETDQRLETARTSGTFDETYAELLQELLVNYGNQLESAFNQSEGSDEKELLANDYQEVVLLLEQLTGEQAETN
jgi:predicted metalloprotease